MNQTEKLVEALEKIVKADSKILKANTKLMWVKSIAKEALESYNDGWVSISQDELMIELADKRLCRFSNLDPTIYSLSLKHTAEHLLDKYSITRLPTPPQTKTI